MQAYQEKFIQLALENNVLRFGEFTLKSGRKSPYFFNAGLFNTGAALAQLGQYYAASIEDSNLEYDMLFGPAYKGITLAASTSIALASQYEHDVPYCFNRKEAKTHGEGGQLIGAPLQGRILIIDDVITAGTAFREAKATIENAGAQVAGVAIALNRQEKGQDDKATIKAIEDTYNIPVIQIITRDNLIEYLQSQQQSHETLNAMHTYKETYGA